MAIIVKGSGVTQKKSTTYNVRFDFTQSYDIVIHNNLEDSKKSIIEILASEDLVKQNFECIEAFEDDVLNYNLYFVSISDVQLDVKENDKGEYEGGACREISLSYLVTIYDLDEFNSVIASSCGVTIAEEYDDEDDEDSDVIQTCSIFTGFYAGAESENFSIEFSIETGGGCIDTKTKVG